MNLDNITLSDGSLTVSDSSQSTFPTVGTDDNRNPRTLRDSVEEALHNYFQHLEGQDVTDVYNMVLSEVEAPLLESVMNYVKGNQTRASEVLGLNRGTLRKKLKQYGLL
jgi:Fis family transcriptional regulator